MRWKENEGPNEREFHGGGKKKKKKKKDGKRPTQLLTP
jgi:hypothetical protein